MKKFLLIGLLLAILAIGVGLMIYHKPHKNMQSAKADFTMPATELYTAFETDESTANTKFLDKVVQVEGVVQSVSKDDAGKISVTLDAGGMLGGVICQLDDLSEHAKTSFEEGEKVVFKGICTGLLMDVVLVRCVVV